MLDTYGIDFLSDITVVILSFRTGKNGKQCRLRVFTVCYSICIFLTKYLKVWLLSLNFRKITAKFSGVRKFRNVMVALAIYDGEYEKLAQQCSLNRVSVGTI